MELLCGRTDVRMDVRTDIHIYIYIYRAATLKSKKYKLDLKMTQIGEKYKLGDKIQAKIQAKI